MGEAGVTKIISLDFELASKLDLSEVGSDVWTKSPDTLPILAGFALDYDEPKSIFFDDEKSLNVDELLDALLDAVGDEAEIHAWNANFEFNVWNNICAPRFGWPKLPVERFHCTMSAAACAGLPMSLEDAAVAVGASHVKDKAGHGLMLRMARPRSVEQDGTVHWWHVEDKAKLAQLAAYNLADVRAEREVHQRIPRMTKREREIWLTDQKMNRRGLPVDKDLLARLSELALFEWLRLDNEIAHITKGAVSGSTQNLKLLAWVQARGYPHDTLEKDTLNNFIGSLAFNSLDSDAGKVLLLRAERAKTSAAKLKAMSEHSQIDGTVRNLAQYGGAVRTLRWAGRGVQIQNYPKPVIKHVPEAIAAIKDGMEPEGLRLLFGRPLDVISSCLRGVYRAKPGEKLVVCDYHAIEAIVIAWLADFQPMLDVFRRREDIYVFTAHGVGSTNRTLGKVLRLACNYGMGHVKFVETAKTYNLDLTLGEAKNSVDAFRKANRPIVEMWHMCENMAANAISNPTSVYMFGRNKLKFRMADPGKRLKGALLMELPSGRHLVYRNARLENGRITFWGVNQYTRKWEEMTTYGGKLVENATQATARDLLADALVEIEDEFPGVLRATIHDEIVALTGEATASDVFDGMMAHMSTPPAWAAGMPLSAAGKILDRYEKI